MKIGAPSSGIAAAQSNYPTIVERDHEGEPANTEQLIDGPSGLVRAVGIESPPNGMATGQEGTGCETRKNTRISGLPVRNRPAQLVTRRFTPSSPGRPVAD